MNRIICATVLLMVTTIFAQREHPLELFKTNKIMRSLNYNIKELSIDNDENHLVSL